MAATTLSSITYNGVTYSVGDVITINSNWYQDLDDTSPSPNDITQYLSQMTFTIQTIYNPEANSSWRNPIQIKVKTTPNASISGTGMIRLSQITSGGTSLVTTGNFVAYVKDQNRKGGIVNSAGNGWFESIYLDWNSWNAPAGIKEWEIWYRQSDDGSNWSGRCFLTRFSSTNNYGNYTFGSVNQASSASNWGDRGKYFQWCVVALDNNGNFSNTEFWSATRRKCTVSAHTFNANGGSGAPATQYKPISYNFVFPSAPTTAKTGHHFIGWNSSASAGDGYAAGTNTSNVPDAAVTWYAIWKANTYSVKYNANGGSGSMSNSSHTYGTSKALTANAFSRTGYAFNGWNTKADGTGTAYANSASVKNLTTSNGGTVNLYAQWAPKTSKVTFYRNYDSSDTTTKNVTYTYGVANQAFAAHWSRTGYTLLGWSTNRSATTKEWSATSGISDSWVNSHSPSVNLYAIWQANDYTYNIVYKSSSGVQLGANSVTQAYGTTKTIEPASFDGYASPASQSIKWDSTTAKTITFVYTPINYNITYDLAGGSLSTANPTSYTIETETFVLNNPTKTNFEFLGWTGSNGNPSTSVSIPKGSIGNKSYTAVWELDCYYLSFNFNNGTGNAETYEALADGAFIIPDITPTRTAYIFKGWSKSATSKTADYIVGDSFTPTGNITLFAVWELDPNHFLKMDLLGCWRTSETTAKLIVITKFFKDLNVATIQTYPSISSSSLNASISTVNLLSSEDVEYSVVDEDDSYFVDEDDSIVQSVNEALEYKYELLLDIDSTVETGHIVLELNDGIKSMRKIVRITGIDEHSDNIYFYKQEAYGIIYDESEDPIYDENYDEIIGKMGTGGYICEAIEFIESDHIVGFQKGGRVYAKEFIEKDGVIIANGMQFTQFIEKVSTVNVITTDNESVLIDSDGAIIRTL